jgi:NADH:ubiquinone oxidoreductase subunit 2 (subunit N)
MRPYTVPYVGTRCLPGRAHPITAFLSAGPKAIGFAILIRIFLKNFFPMFPDWVDIVQAVSI